MKKHLFGIFGMLATVGIAYIIFGAMSGAKDAIAAKISQDICGSVKAGITMNQVSELAISKKAWFRAYAPDGVRVGADGWYSKCRCNVLFKNGVVDTVSKPVCIN